MILYIKPQRKENFMPFEAGKSGNPNGRPTKAQQARKGTPNAKLRKLLQQLEQNLPDAVVTLVDLMGNPEAPPNVQMQAAKTILSEYKDIYQMLEGPAKEKVDDEDNDELPKAPVIDFSQVVKTD